MYYKCTTTSTVHVVKRCHVSRNLTNTPPSHIQSTSKKRLFSHSNEQDDWLDIDNDNDSDDDTDYSL
jgi:hypothetical protein